MTFVHQADTKSVRLEDGNIMFGGTFSKRVIFREITSTDKVISRIGPFFSPPKQANFETIGKTKVRRLQSTCFLHRLRKLSKLCLL